MERPICAHGFVLADRKTLLVAAACGTVGKELSHVLNAPLADLVGEPAATALAGGAGAVLRDAESVVRAGSVLLPGTIAIRIACRPAEPQAADALIRLEDALAALAAADAGIDAAAEVFRTLGDFTEAVFWRERDMRARFGPYALRALESGEAFALCPKAGDLRGTWATIDGRIEDFAEGAGVAHAYARLAEEFGAHSAVIVPLIVEGRLCGALAGIRGEQACAPDAIVSACRMFGLALSAQLSRSGRGIAGLDPAADADPLTGAATRRGLAERLQRRGTLMRRRVHALVVFDLDRFKTINDALGSEGGDRLLCAVAQRIRGIMRRSDVLARIGADEFAVLYENIRENEAPILAERVTDAFARPFFVEGRLLRVTISAGVAFAGETQLADLMRNADVAMFDAKRGGGNQLSVFSPDTRAEMAERLTMEQHLHTALARKEFVIDVQPIVRLADGSLWGAEALVRWNHPRIGSIPPLQFIKLAEETGLISSVGRQVIGEAARCFKRWQSERRIDESFRLSINFSSRDLMREESAADILDLLRETGLPPQSICAELTESAILADPQRVCSALAQLRDAGAEIAVDDFGTGYSSLAFLRTLPITIVKIDRSFVVNMLAEERDLALVRSMLQLAHDLGMRVIAEGIESQQVADALRNMGCDFAQGFHLGEPCRPELFQKLFLKTVLKG